MFVRSDHLKVLVWFEVVESLSVDLGFDKTFTDGSIRALLPGESRVVTGHLISAWRLLLLQAVRSFFSDIYTLAVEWAHTVASASVDHDE